MDLREPPPREREKARTRQAPAGTAPRPLTEKGFEVTAST